VIRTIHIAAALLLLASAAQAQDPSRRGRALLDEFCAQCHAVGRTGDSPHAAAPPFRRLNGRVDLDAFARQLQRGLVSNHPDMPEFKFSEDDARAAAAYLRSIQQ
jgi:mono/diheme cytochrome c family protein